MSLNIDTLQVITAPSFFKIELGEITDESGNLIDLSQNGIVFTFADNYSNFYNCVHDPFDETKSSNVVYDQENNSLTLIFQNYKLRDRLKLKICNFTEDSDFTEGVWKSYDGFTQIKLCIAWK